MSITSQGRTARLSSAALSRTSADGGVSRVLHALVSLFRRPAPAQPSPLRLAQIEREAAAVAYVLAKIHPHSRDFYWAERRYQRATAEQMHQERLAGVR